MAEFVRAKFAPASPPRTSSQYIPVKSSPASSPRTSPRIKTFHTEDELLHTRRPKKFAPTQNERSQGVLAPYSSDPQPSKTPDAMGRKRHLDPASNRPYLSRRPDAVMVIADRPGSPLHKSWYEQAPGRTALAKAASAAQLHTDSAGVTETLTGPAQRPEDEATRQTVERQRRIFEVTAGRHRAEPLTTDAPPPVEAHLPQRLQAFASPSGAGEMPSVGRGGTWREAFLRFPREHDGTVSVSKFVSTLKQLAGQGGATTSSDGRPGAVAIHDTDVERIVSLLDPSGSGSITFSRFAKAFAHASVDEPAARSLQLDGTGALRTHSRATRMSAPSAAAASDEAGAATARLGLEQQQRPDASFVAPEEDGGDRGGETLGPGAAAATAAPTPRAQRFLRGSSGPLITAADPSDAAAPSSRKVASLSRDITTRMHQLFGTHPSAFRRMFMRFARTADGTAGVEDVAKGLRQAGLPDVSDADVALLLGVPPHGGAQGAGAAPRVTYDSFAHAVALTALTGRPPASHAAAAAQEMERARALGSAALAQPPVGDEPRRASAPAAGVRLHPEYYGGGAPSDAEPGAAPGPEQRATQEAAAFDVPSESVLLLSNTPAAQPHVQMSSSSMVEILRDPLLTSATSLGAAAADADPQHQPGLGLGATGLASPLRVERHVGMTADGKKHFDNVGALAAIQPVQAVAHHTAEAVAAPEQVKTADVLQRVRKQLSIRGDKAAEAFLRMDRQRDALLTPVELRRGLERSGVLLDDESFGRIYALMDPEARGALDHAAFARVLYPPDTHPDTKVFPFERGVVAPPAALGTRTLVAAPVPAPEPSYADMVRGEDADDGIGSAEQPAAGLPAAGHSATAAGVPGPSWLDLPTVDQAGLYSTARDASSHAAAAHSRRHFNLDQPAPYLHGMLQPRDTWGTPAPYLLPAAVSAAAAAPGSTHRGSVHVETVSALENALWTSGQPSPLSAAPASGLTEAKLANKLVRRVMDKLRSKGEAAAVWMKLNHAHDGKVSVKDLREGLARMGVQLTPDEFSLFSRRVDISQRDRITFGEFARAFKGDDPIPDSFFYKGATAGGLPIAGSTLLAPGASQEVLPGASLQQSVGLSRDPQSNAVVSALKYRKNRYIGPDPADPAAGLTSPRNQAVDSSAVATSLIQEDGASDAVIADSGDAVASSLQRPGARFFSGEESAGEQQQLQQRPSSSPPGTRRRDPLRTPGASSAAGASGRGGAFVATSMLEAHLATDISDRLYRRFAASGGGARDVFVRLASVAGDSSARVPTQAADFHACLRALGVPASRRQVEAFLRPVAAQGSTALDFPTFAALVQPRGYLEDSTAGAPPAFVPADFVRKANAARSVDFGSDAPEAAAATSAAGEGGRVAAALSPARISTPWAGPGDESVAAGARLRPKSASCTARRPAQLARSATNDSVRALLEEPAPPPPTAAVVSEEGGPTPKPARNPVLAEHDANPFLTTYRATSAAATQPAPPQVELPPASARGGSRRGPSAAAPPPPPSPVVAAGVPSFRDPRAIQQQSRYVNLPPNAWAAVAASPGRAPLASPGGTLGRFGHDSTTVDAPEALAAVPRSEKRIVATVLSRTFSSSIFSDPQYPSNLVGAPRDEPRADGYSTRPLPRGRARSVEPGFSTSRKRLLAHPEEARGVISEVTAAARAPPAAPDNERTFMPGYTGFRSASRPLHRSASVDASLRRPSAGSVLNSTFAGVATARQPTTVAVSSDAGARSEKKHYSTEQIRSDGVWDSITMATH